MGRPEFEALAAKLEKELDNYKNTIPGMLRLDFSGLRTVDNKITLHLESKEFMELFPSVDEIVQLRPWEYHVTVKIGELAITAVLGQDEIKKYLSAESSASNRPGPVLCGDQEIAQRVPVAR